MFSTGFKLSINHRLVLILKVLLSTVCVQGWVTLQRTLVLLHVVPTEFQGQCDTPDSDRVIRVSNSCRRESFFKATLNYQERSAARVPACQETSACTQQKFQKNDYFIISQVSTSLTVCVLGYLLLCLPLTSYHSFFFFFWNWRLNFVVKSANQAKPCVELEVFPFFFFFFFFFAHFLK